MSLFTYSSASMLARAILYTNVANLTEEERLFITEYKRAFDVTLDETLVTLNHAQARQRSLIVLCNGKERCTDEFWKCSDDAIAIKGVYISTYKPDHPMSFYLLQQDVDNFTHQLILSTTQSSTRFPQLVRIFAYDQVAKSRLLQSIDTSYGALHSAYTDTERSIAMCAAAHAMIIDYEQFIVRLGNLAKVNTNTVRILLGSHHIAFNTDYTIPIYTHKHIPIDDIITHVPTLSWFEYADATAIASILLPNVYQQYTGTPEQQEWLDQFERAYRKADGSAYLLADVMRPLRTANDNFLSTLCIKHHYDEGSYHD